MEQTIVTVDQLRPFTNYTFYVVAYNNESASSHSQTITQMTGEDGKNCRNGYLATFCLLFLGVTFLMLGGCGVNVLFRHSTSTDPLRGPDGPPAQDAVLANVPCKKLEPIVA